MWYMTAPTLSNKFRLPTQSHGPDELCYLLVYPTCMHHHIVPHWHCRKIVNETLSKWGQLDVLVNNASFQGKAVEKFEEITRERMEFTFHSNILNYFSTCQAAAKHMKAGSTIININSIQGSIPSCARLFNN